ncbi:MAG: TonB-dependent receptor domain-containing protein, partial [bacterium]
GGGSSSPCGQDLTGERSNNSPEYSFNLSANWFAPISENVELEATATVMYEDEFYVSADLDDVLLQDSYTKLDLRLGLNDLANDAWSVAVAVKNVTDEETFHYGNDVPFTPGARFVRMDAPRTVTISGTYRF